MKMSSLRKPAHKSARCRERTQKANKAALCGGSPLEHTCGEERHCKRCLFSSFTGTLVNTTAFIYSDIWPFTPFLRISQYAFCHGLLQMKCMYTLKTCTCEKIYGSQNTTDCDCIKKRETQMLSFFLLMICVHAHLKAHTHLHIY